MPHDVTVDLGNYTILSNLDKNLVLTITASMSLSLAEEHLEFSTAAELREKVKAGSLWITRAGSCNFELRADFNDLPSHGLSEHLEHMVVDAFETFPVREERITAKKKTPVTDGSCRHGARLASTFAENTTGSMTCRVPTRPIHIPSNMPNNTLHS